MLHAHIRIPTLTPAKPRAESIAAHTSHRQCTWRRGGFTLMELILVLGVLVVLTAITLPGILRRQRALPMERAVSLLQLQLQETRAAAVRSGEEWYLILPQANQPGRRESAATNHERNQPHAFVLPEGVRCEIIESSETSNSQPKLQTQIVFQPDGTVRACRIRVTTNDGIVTILQIHRMTGMATIVELQERERTQNTTPEAIASKWTQRRGKI